MLRLIKHIFRRRFLKADLGYVLLFVLKLKMLTLE